MRRDYIGWKGMAPSRAGYRSGFGAYFLPGPEGSIKAAGGFWPNRRRPHLSSFCRGPAIRGELAMNKKIDISAIPELGTSVGMHGSVKQTEVFGPFCLGVVFAAIMGLSP
jgi:hypothetical protein